MINENLGPIIENMVFLHLKRQVKTGDSLFYYKTRSGKEIDFLVFHEGKVRLFQVCWDLARFPRFPPGTFSPACPFFSPCSLRLCVRQF